LNKNQAFLFARKHNLPVISWRTTLTEESDTIFAQAARGEPARMDEIMDAIPEMTFYFVCGAPAILKDNLWTTAGLVNGRICKMHSLTLSGPTSVESWGRINQAGPGQEVMLPIPPLSINIALEDSSPQLMAHSIASGETIIPLMLQKMSRPLSLAKNLRFISRQGAKKPKLAYYDFGVDLAFAVTYHKVQGRTIDRVMIDCSAVERMTVAAIYVAISRTRKQDHIRILQFTNGRITRRQLEKKEFEPILVQWWAFRLKDQKLMKKILAWKTGDPEPIEPEETDSSSDSGDHESDSAHFQSQRRRIGDVGIEEET